MAVRDALLVVEGQHDAAFVARLLKEAGYERVKDKDALPSEWRRLVPTGFPKPGRGIDEAHELPKFRALPSGELVGVVVATGDSNLARAMVSTLLLFGQLPLALAFVLDEDQEPNPAVRHTSLLKEVQSQSAALLSSLVFPPSPGGVSVQNDGSRTGTFVFPDNQSAGTLEDVLLQAGNVAYSNLLTQADVYIQALDETGLTPKEIKEGHKPAGRKKQVIGATATIFKPCRALANSLQDDRWLEGAAALAQPYVRTFRQWLHALLELPPV